MYTAESLGTLSVIKLRSLGTLVESAKKTVYAAGSLGTLSVINLRSLGTLVESAKKNTFSCKMTDLMQGRLKYFFKLTGHLKCFFW